MCERCRIRPAIDAYNPPNFPDGTQPARWRNPRTGSPNVILDWLRNKAPRRDGSLIALEERSEPGTLRCWRGVSTEFGFLNSSTTAESAHRIVTAGSTPAREPVKHSNATFRTPRFASRASIRSAAAIEPLTPHRRGHTPVNPGVYAVFRPRNSLLACNMSECHRCISTRESF